VAKILIVDDNAINRKLLVAVLTYAGYSAIEASDGVEGLRVAYAERPQLIISDIVMPSMDGFGFVRALRADSVLRATRVIFCTAIYHEREAARLAHACDVACVLVKPCDPADVVTAVKQTLAGASESDPTVLTDSFDREHLLLMTNKLSERSDALEASNARLLALMDLNIIFTSHRDPHILLEKVCTGARNLLGSRYAVLAVTEEGSNRPRFFATSGIDFGHIAPPAPGLSAGPLGGVVANRRPWRGHATDGTHVNAGLPPGYPLAKAFLAVPLLTKSRALGWLCLAEKIGADAFDEDDERLLCGLGSLAGRIYENCALQEELLLHLEHLRERSERSRVLIDNQTAQLNRLHGLLGGLAILTAQAQTRERLCGDACRLMIEHGGVRLAFTEVQDPATGGLVLLAAAGDVTCLSQRQSRQTSSLDFLLASVMDSMQPVICNNLQNASEYLAFHQEMFKNGFRTLAVMPLRSGDASNGCLVLLADEADTFGEAETRVLHDFVDGLSLALGRINKETSLA
jgi:CheY-like chemotaxis protein/GAF domain-containing protein